MSIVVAALYHFFPFSSFTEWREPLLRVMRAHEVKGSLLLAEEGINGTVAGSREGIDALMDYLRSEVIGEVFEVKESFHSIPPFKRSKVRLKKETISLGESFSMQRRGQYVSSRAWNDLIADSSVVVIDARNDYEVHLGTFEGARNPATRNFKELPAYVRALNLPKDTRIATFCTGGIRCEKFTSWLITQGYEDVHHLQGGILKYLEEIPPEESKWQGECYVFDERVAVGHGLVASQNARLCGACGNAVKAEEVCC